MAKWQGLFSVAPLLGATDRHYRHYARVLSKHALLYTEMVNSRAITQGRYADYLAGNAKDGPVVLQLGGFDPQDMAQAALAGEHSGFDEINMNVGCPSPRGVAARFGVCLMAEPETVARCVEAMASAVRIPVTVKCRLGIDEDDSLPRFMEFVRRVSEAGCQTFIIHARKALLSEGISPKQNRAIPPLRYEDVYLVKKSFPHLKIVINGGIKTIAECQQHLEHVDGVMLGREAYHNFYLLSQVDAELFDEPQEAISREEFLRLVRPDLVEKVREGVNFSHLVRHLLGLYKDVQGAAIWRRYLSEHGFRPGSGVEVLDGAIACLHEYYSDVGSKSVDR